MTYSSAQTLAAGHRIPLPAASVSHHRSLLPIQAGWKTKGGVRNCCGKGSLLSTAEQVCLLTKPSYKCQKHLLLPQFSTEDVQVVVDSAPGQRWRHLQLILWEAFPADWEYAPQPRTYFTYPNWWVGPARAVTLKEVYLMNWCFMMTWSISVCICVERDSQQNIGSVQKRLGEEVWRENVHVEEALAPIPTLGVAPPPLTFHLYCIGESHLRKNVSDSTLGKGSGHPPTGGY